MNMFVYIWGGTPIIGGAGAPSSLSVYLPLSVNIFISAM